LPRKLTLVIPSAATISSLVFGVLAIMVLADWKLFVGSDIDYFRLNSGCAGRPVGR